MTLDGPFEVYESTWICDTSRSVICNSRNYAFGGIAGNRKIINIIIREMYK